LADSRLIHYNVYINGTMTATIREMITLGSATPFSVLTMSGKSISKKLLYKMVKGKSALK